MYYYLEQKFADSNYCFFAPLGFLYKKTKLRPRKMNESVQQFKYWVDNPYCLQRRDDGSEMEIRTLIKWYAHLLIFLHQHFYFGLYLLSFLRMPVFEDAGSACKAFRTIILKNQNKLCLPRAVFVSTTSKRFRKNGAMYIGVFLPSRQMHAWVIEDEMHADVNDDYWQMYTPVAIMK